MHKTLPTLRSDVHPADRDAVRRIVEATSFFRSDEVNVAVELVDEALAKGQEASGYYFVFAEIDGEVAGYTCYGPVACTLGSYDLFWIAVDPKWQGQGIGQILLIEAEGQIVARGGRHIYIETSGRPQYTPTRAFYERCGYELAAVLTEFYDRGDDKVIWRKVCAM
jgi:ribosomal protein S18 acetylase RimI-like enzyme